MKHIKLFEAFKSEWIRKFFKDHGFQNFLAHVSDDLRMSEIKDIEGDEEVIKFMSAIEGYDYFNEVKTNVMNEEWSAYDADPDEEFDKFDKKSENCEECDGRGFVDCTDCGGSGESDCSSCGGTGLDSEEDDCSDCDGSGKEGCYTCSADATVMCTDCNGDGIINVSDTEVKVKGFGDDETIVETKKNYEIVKAFFNDEPKLVVLLDKNNVRLTKSHIVDWSSQDLYINTHISRYDSQISKENIIKCSDYCIIINIDILRSKYGGKEDLESDRANRKEDVLAFKDNSVIKEENIQRYEDIIFGRYGFHTDLENFKTGVVKFNEKLFNRVPPIMIFYLHMELKSLFTNIKRNLIKLNLDNERAYNIENTIKTSLRKVFNKINKPIFTEEEVIKNISESNDDDVTNFYENSWPLIKDFNDKFVANTDILETADVIEYCDRYNALEKLIDDMDFDVNIYRSLYTDFSSFAYNVPGGRSGIRASKILELVTKTTIKIFK